jgi:two-component system, OmpR family, sensor histidine kinase VicK
LTLPLPSNNDNGTTTTTTTTKIIQGTNDVVDAEVAFFSRTKKIADTYMNYTRPPLAVGLGPIKKAFLDAKNRGVHMRYLTEITKDNLSYCKELMSIVDELRHLDGIKGNFMVGDTEYVAPLILFEHGKIAPQAVYSNTKEVVEQQQYLFDNFWRQGVSGEKKIKEIEEEVESEFLEVITNKDDANKILLELSKSVKKEALFILPTDNAMIRVDRLGVIDSLIDASQNGAIIKIICPLSEKNSQLVSKMSKVASSIQILNGSTSPAAGIFIVDGVKFSRTELGEFSDNNDKIQLSQAARFTVYSNSKPTVELFRSIFGLLWNERTLNEQLRLTDNMQRDFINIAAHELRTPIQPILGLSQILSSKLINTEYSDHLNIIVKNALKLQRLTDDILDVQKIESKTLNLNKERFELNNLILDIVRDYRNLLQNKEGKSHDIEIDVSLISKDITVFIEADKHRLIQVVTNLLNNAVKFTEEGRITIRLDQGGNNLSEVVVSVRDTGKGIDPDILPRLFSRFVSKSYQGTGLGLYISKGIVEAHGGKIWAENNDGANGAIFAFSLPGIGTNTLVDQ